MSRIIKARVTRGRYSGETVRISNVSADEMDRKNAACILANGARANISVDDLEIIPDKAPKTSEIRHAICERCGANFNLEERKGHPGKITECEHCAVETENKMEGRMIFSHKTGATIEIKKDGKLRHEAPIFDPKNKT